MTQPEQPDMPAALRLSEADWQQRITDYATLKGWLHLHLRPARTVKGWRTAVSGQLGKGWPDMFLVRGDQLVALELKSQTGRTTTDQAAVLAALARAGVRCLVARPSDWDAVQEVLR